MMDEALLEICRSFNNNNDLATHVDDVFKNLQQQAKHLFAKEEDTNKVIAGSQVALSTTHECATWMDDVKKIKQDLEDIKKRYEGVCEQEKSLINFNHLVKLREEMVKKIDAIAILKDRVLPETISSMDNITSMVEKKFGKEIIEVKAFYDIVENILGYLNDDSIRSIGLWGMAGVGKTTIMEILSDEVEKRGMFDIVIWVTVSKEGGVDKIQRAIVNKMKLNVDGIKCDYHMTSLVCKALKKKKYLVLLDDVFSEVDLGAIGILDTHEHGKLVVATRYRFVCHLMGVNEDIKVERMCRGDAWKLFQKIVGEAVDHPIMKPIAERMLKECGELPHLIQVVARTLRNKLSEDVWLRILLKLQTPTDNQLHPMEEVSDIFRLVYDGLDDNLKQCLLYGASFPEDYEICQDYLIECWKAEELIPDAHMFSKARQEGLVLLENLIERYLLQRCKEKEYVKMPIVFRNMALRIANGDSSWLLLVKPKVKLGPLVEQWRHARVVSLMSSNLQCLPARPENCGVSTLLLQHNEMLTKIPPFFFEFMTCLKVLDLSGTGIRSLPETISSLSNLRGLYLNRCQQLAMLPRQLAELKNLEVLEICHTGLHGLPTYIGELIHLQCLKVSFMGCRCCEDNIEILDVDMIPPNVVKRLSLIQELTIDVDPRNIRWKTVAPMIAEEVATLSMLNSLSFYFPSLECFETFISSSISWNNSLFPLLHDKFRSFRFTVAPPDLNRFRELNIPRCFTKRHLKYFDGKGIPKIISKVLRQVCIFEMVGHESVKNLSDFGTDVMERLEICIIEGCCKLEKIMGPDTPPTVVFPSLKELHLLKLQQFHCIWGGSILPRSFSKLTTVTLYDCGNVKTLLSVGMATYLQELQFLRIEKCSQLTEVIGADHHTEKQTDMFGTLPSLKSLELISLQSLVNICNDDLLEWPSLCRVEIIGCEVLAVLPFSGKNAVQLQSICCSEGWWATLKLQQEVKAQLQQICHFV